MLICCLFVGMDTCWLIAVKNRMSVKQKVAESRTAMHGLCVVTPRTTIRVQMPPRQLRRMPHHHFHHVYNLRHLLQPQLLHPLHLRHRLLHSLLWWQLQVGEVPHHHPSAPKLLVSYSSCLPVNLSPAWMSPNWLEHFLSSIEALPILIIDSYVHQFY